MAAPFPAVDADLAKTIPKPTSAQQRREIALSLAAKCTQVLKEEFGAQEVIVFGSLRGDTPWHSASDLDLAVRGLSKDKTLEASNYL